METTEINGTPKELTTECPTCSNGKLWNNLSDTDKYYEDDDASRNFEAICNGCMTKYIFPKEFTPDMLSYNNLLSWGKKIRMEEEQMLTPQILKEREEYETTGVCLENKFVPTSVKTSQGKFELQTCLITKQTKLTYNNKPYMDTLSNILNFLAMKGIEHDNIKKDKELNMKKADDIVVKFDDIISF